MTGRPDQQHIDSIQAEVNRGKALELRIGGASFRDIAKALSVSVSTAHGYVEQSLEEIADENSQKAERVRAMEVVRLDKLLMSLWTKRDQPRYVDSILRIMERRARLLGLDAAIKWEGSGPGGGPIPISGEIDLSQLSIEELLFLERLSLRGKGTATVATPPAIAATSQSTSIDPPSTNGNGNGSHP